MTNIFDWKYIKRSWKDPYLRFSMIFYSFWILVFAVLPFFLIKDNINILAGYILCPLMVVLNYLIIRVSIRVHWFRKLSDLRINRKMRDKLKDFFSVRKDHG